MIGSILAILDYFTKNESLFSNFPSTKSLQFSIHEIHIRDNGSNSIEVFFATRFPLLLGEIYLFPAHTNKFILGWFCVRNST